MKTIKLENYQPYRGRKVKGENAKEHDIHGEPWQPRATTCSPKTQQKEIAHSGNKGTQ
jgi:hypothetical protein